MCVLSSHDGLPWRGATPFYAIWSRPSIDVELLALHDMQVIDLGHAVLHAHLVHTVVPVLEVCPPSLLLRVCK